MPQTVFAREVLGDGVPSKVAEVRDKVHQKPNSFPSVNLFTLYLCILVNIVFCLQQIYTAFGGTNKGITFRDLLCGLVLLTRGTREEKIKCKFGICLVSTELE